MKKTLLVLAVSSAFGLCATASAQSSVNIYGLIDVSVRTANNQDANGSRVVAIATPWFSGSRWGLQGKEDLGDGLKAIFRLESEFVLGNGAMDTPGVLFNRDAWVGMESDVLGKITLGRQNTVARDFAQVYGDAYGSAKLSTDEGGFTNTNNFKQLIFYAGSDSGTRLDNGIVWKKAFGNGLVAGLGYKLGEAPGDSAKNTTKSGALGYNGANFVIAGFYTSANVNNQTHQSYSVGGSYMLDKVRLNAGYFHYTADQGVGNALGQRKDDAYTLSAKFTPGSAIDYEVGYQIMKANNAAYKADGSSILNAYANANTATVAGTGKKSTLYASTFYHFSKRTEVYLAADYMKLTDGYRAGTSGFSNQTEVAVGMRTRF